VEHGLRCGLGTVVKRAHPEPDVDLTYIDPLSTGDGGDQYVGLDRFGRIVNQLWTDGTTTTDHFQYGYDRNSNRLYRENVLEAAFSELYGYDDLNQLTNFARGTLNSTKEGISGSASRTQAWTLDAMGNWTTVTTDTVAENRTHDAQNEVTGFGSNTLTFDTNGNLTTDENDNQLFYDAWNKLVEVQDDLDNPLASYGYNALGRRIIEIHGAETKELYYSAAWQVLEEQIEGDTAIQYVWSPIYADALVLRDRDTNDNGLVDERLYVQQDANYNVTALLDTSGNVEERYVYDPYGKATILDDAWSTLTSSAFGWEYLHQGGRLGEETELYSFRHREFSPTLGRWLQKDPLSFTAEDANLYRYVVSNPVKFTDPLGLFAQIGFAVPTPWGFFVTFGVEIDVIGPLPFHPFLGVGFGVPNAWFLGVPGPVRNGLHFQACGFIPKPAAGPLAPPLGWPAWLPFPRFLAPGGGIQRPLNLFPGGAPAPLRPMLGGGPPRGFFVGLIWVFFKTFFLRVTVRLHASNPRQIHGRKVLFPGPFHPNRLVCA
jgi:RHS repeat-associated protein